MKWIAVDYYLFFSSSPQPNCLYLILWCAVCAAVCSCKILSKHRLSWAHAAQSLCPSVQRIRPSSAPAPVTDSMLREKMMTKVALAHKSE